MSEIKKTQTFFHVPVAPNVFRTSVQLHGLPCLVRNWLDLQSWQRFHESLGDLLEGSKVTLWYERVGISQLIECQL